MNRNAASSSMLLTRKKTSLINKNVSKPLPLGNDKDKELGDRLDNIEKKLAENLGNVEKQLEATNITLEEVKEDLKNTKVRLNDANVEIEKLNAEIKEMRADHVQLKEGGKLTTEMHREPEHGNGNVRIEKSATIEKGAVRIALLHNAYVKLPYDSIDELKVFKDDLKNPEIYIHLKTRLKCIGGDGVTECVTKVLNAIMTPKLQGQISLTGKGTDKDSLLTKFKEVSDLIHDVVRANKSDYKDKTGNEIIGKLLRSRN